jgi:hypothetical protein
VSKDGRLETIAKELCFLRKKTKRKKLLPVEEVQLRALTKIVDLL